MPELTIGMATYNDFEGVYFTLQSLRLFQDLDDTELLVVDNYGCDHTRRFVEGWTNARYVLWTDVEGTAPAKERVFHEATGDVVLCCDSHVVFPPGVISRLKQFYRDHPTCDDLVQGPLLNDDLKSLSTNLDPVWRGQQWGTWATDPRGVEPDGEPFEIAGQGMGAFACRRSAWVGFNPRFRGYGGEEGYIHEKFRRAGRRTLCLPSFRWIHRFGRPLGIPYSVTVEDKFRNYLIGYVELGLDLEPVIAHFSESLSQEAIVAITVGALWPDDSERAPTAEAAPSPPDDKTASARKPRPRSDPAAWPSVSCICPTFGRPHLLEEAIESFLRQDYPGQKELIVLNDLDQQVLRFDHPEVSIINVPRRFRSLGEKYNAAVALASHDLLFPWEDDDINLPHRLRFSVDQLDRRMGFFKPSQAWFWNEGTVSGPEENLFHAQSCWSRELFDSVGGYAAMNSAHDLDFESRIEAHRRGSTAPLDVASQDLYYLYRWAGTASYHGSWFQEEEHQSVGEYVREELRSGRLEAGEISLKPRWHADYEALVRARLLATST